MSLKNLAIGFVGILAIACGSVSHAQLMNDDFTYADGNLSANAAWVVHGAGGTAVQVLNGKAVVQEPQTEDIHRDIGSTLATGSTWYYALRMSVADTRTVPGTGSIFPAYFAHFMEANPPAGQESMFRGRLYIQGTSDPTKFTLGLSSGTVSAPLVTADADFDGTPDPANNYELDVDGNDFLTWQRGVGRTTTVTNAVGDANNDFLIDNNDLDIWKSQYNTNLNINGARVRWSGDLSFDTEYTVVVSYTADDDDSNPLLTEDGYAKLWVGTDSATAAASTPLVDANPNTNIINDATRPQAWLALRQSATFNANGPAKISIDEVAVDATLAGVLASVAPAVPAVASVPEPASAALLVCGLAVLARRRRRS